MAEECSPNNEAAVNESNEVESLPSLDDSNNEMLDMLDNVPELKSCKKRRVVVLAQLLLHGHETSLGWWVLIFSFLLSKRDYLLRIALRRQCKLFRDALNPVVNGIYTTFPHPRHASLKDLIHSLNNLSKHHPEKTPKIIFVQAG